MANAPKSALLALPIALLALPGCSANDGAPTSSGRGVAAGAGGTSSAASSMGVGPTGMSAATSGMGAETSGNSTQTASGGVNAWEQQLPGEAPSLTSENFTAQVVNGMHDYPTTTIGLHNFLRIAFGI